MTVKRGDPLAIRASDWNAMLGLASSAKLRQAVQLSPGSAFSAGSGVVVPVRNATGATVSRYHAMALGAPLFTPTDNAQTFLNQLGFIGETPSATYLGRFAIAQETIANGKIGACLVSGLTAARITVGHADHNRADVDTAGGATLVSHVYGAAEILWKEAGTGAKWALVRVGIGLGAKENCWATFDDDFTTGNQTVAGTIQNQWGAGIDHGDTAIVLYNHPTDVSGTYIFSGSAGGWCTAQWRGTSNEWNIIIPQCPEP